MITGPSHIPSHTQGCHWLAHPQGQGVAVVAISVFSPMGHALQREERRARSRNGHLWIDEPEDGGVPGSS